MDRDALGVTHSLGPQLDLAEVRAIQLELLREFADYCKGAGLRWSLFGGTLLGAVRHRGYIPWDDDIDVSMPRSDFERLCEHFAPPHPDRSLASLTTQDDYYFPFAMYCDDTTVVQEHYAPMARYGVHVDIFPIDAWPGTRWRRGIMTISVLLLRGLLGVRVVLPSSRLSSMQRWLTRLGRLLLRPWSPRTFAGLLDMLVRRDRGRTRRVGLIAWGAPNAVDAEVFDTTVLLPFEGEEYPAPAGWHEWLESNYGAYLTLPPESERVRNHRWTAHRLGRP